jgi:hypothetical protein
VLSPLASSLCSYNKVSVKAVKRQLETHVACVCRHLVELAKLFFRVRAVRKGLARSWYALSESLMTWDNALVAQRRGHALIKAAEEVRLC